MSLQDKISSAKPTTFLTDGLSREEVKQAVDEGRKRTDTVKLIIEIPKELYENKKGYLTNMDAYMICKAVQNGTLLDDVRAEIDQLPLVLLAGNYHIDKDYVMEILDRIGRK